MSFSLRSLNTRVSLIFKTISKKLKYSDVSDYNHIEKFNNQTGSNLKLQYHASIFLYLILDRFITNPSNPSTQVSTKPPKKALISQISKTRPKTSDSGHK